MDSRRPITIDPMIVAFDADDTLWHNENHFEATHRAFERLLAPWSSATEVDDRLFEVEMRNMDRYGYGVKAFTLSMTETAIDLSDGDVPASVISEIIRLGHDILDRDIVLLDGVVDVLDSLADHTLMLITKGDLYAQRRSIDRSGLADRFWRIEIVAHKDTDTYRRLLELHGVPVSEFVMVGNSLKSDVLPVLELGGRGVHVPYQVTWAHEHVEPDAPIPTLDHIAELPALIEAWR